MAVTTAHRSARLHEIRSRIAGQLAQAAELVDASLGEVVIDPTELACHTSAVCDLAEALRHLEDITGPLLNAEHAGDFALDLDRLAEWIDAHHDVAARVPVSTSRLYAYASALRGEVTG